MNPISSPKISVIVPVYKASQFLEQCIESILNQSQSGIELILVNDVSPDPKDEEICLQYASRYASVSYIKHDENKKAGGARNTGILAAKGKYVGFVDSDDWIDSGMYAELFTVAERTNADFVQCFFYREDGECKRLQKLKSFRFQADKMHAVNALIWNKLFRRDLFIKNDIFFPEGISSEDIALMSKLSYVIEKAPLVRRAFYHYRVNREEATTSDFSKLMEDLPVVFQDICDFLKKHNRLDKDRLFYERRVLKSINHHLERFIKSSDDFSNGNEAVIQQKLSRCLAFLNVKTISVNSDLRHTLSVLKSYKRKIDRKVFFIELKYAFRSKRNTVKQL